MKKRVLALILAALLLCAVLGACGAKGAAENSYDSSQMKPGGSMNMGVTGDSYYDAPSDAAGGESWDGVMDSVGEALNPTVDMAEKIIYTADVEIETVDFDAAVDSVEDMLQRYGAFLESSSVTGRSYSETVGGYKTYRRAYFTIRVPVGAFNTMRDELGGIGAVVSSNVYNENITQRFYDTEARVKSYEIEQERLMSMLEKCETVGEMIEIESRLSEVRYELESLETTLRNWQNRVDYSTINASIREVEEYKRVVEPHRTYWQQIGDGLRNTMEDVGDFFAELFKDIIVSLPVIAIVAVVGVAVIVIAVRCTRRARAKRLERYSNAVDADVEPEDKK